ncbi:MAG: Gfo/Idh/MocA family oxidoreductase [Flavobacteriales bacterium]|nr:Gfo/Idh/MocA family oxidoreductase [Flavobacteriales bacterium]
MSEQKKIRFAVVGCGHIGKRHIAEIQANPKAELLAVCDVKEKSEIEDFGVPYFNSLDELLLSDLAFDVVSICTPNGMHASQSLLALQNCNVLVEKPMALSVSDANSMIQKEKESGNQLFCVMQNRYSPPAIWLKSLIENNSMGEIYMVHLNCFWNRDDRYYNSANWRGTIDLDGGTLFTQFSHFIDILFHLFDNIKVENVMLNDFNHSQTTDFEDSGIISFSLEENAIGNMKFSTAVFDKNMESSITVIGKKGSVKVGGQYMEKIEYCHIENYEIPKLSKSNKANDYGKFKGSANNHHFVIENVIETLKGNTTKDATPKQCLEVIAFIEDIYKRRKIESTII